MVNERVIINVNYCRLGSTERESDYSPVVSLQPAWVQGTWPRIYLEKIRHRTPPEIPYFRRIPGIFVWSRELTICCIYFKYTHSWFHKVLLADLITQDLAFEMECEAFNWRWELCYIGHKSSAELISKQLILPLISVNAMAFSSVDAVSEMGDSDVEKVNTGKILAKRCDQFWFRLFHFVVCPVHSYYRLWIEWQEQQEGALTHISGMPSPSLVLPLHSVVWLPCLISAQTFVSLAFISGHSLPCSITLLVISISRCIHEAEITSEVEAPDLAAEYLLKKTLVSSPVIHGSPLPLVS